MYNYRLLKKKDPRTKNSTYPKYWIELIHYLQPKTTEDSLMSAVSGSDEELDRLRKVLVEAIDEAKTKSSRQRKYAAVAYL